MKSPKLALLTIVLGLTSPLFAIAPPLGWGDFQIGLVNNDRTEWDVPMQDAQNLGSQYHLDRRYIYIDDTLNIKSYWTGTKNWSKNSFYQSKNVKPAIVIYMLQRGGDSWSSIKAACEDKTFMEAYFRYIALIADSSKGAQPIYVIEPDVWSYVLQNARESDPNRYTTTGDDWSKIQNNNLNQLCHINDLGLPWLSEFDNTLSDLPGAIIKTLKLRDPASYAGVLIGFWGFNPSTATSSDGLFHNSSAVIEVGARETAKYLKALLSSTPYRGDFAGLEKNGSDLGYWKQQNNTPYINAFDWDDRENSDWVKFAKTISDSLSLPMIGWQIAIGHPGLANIANEYEDTFFPYFFSHTQEYLNAGIIGMLAGCANQGKGTMATPPNGQLYIHPDNHPSGTRGDDGWFYTQLATFNAGRPYLPLTETHTIIAEVVADTVYSSTSSKYPAWSATTTYQNKGTDTVAYNGYDWLGVSWYSLNNPPGTDTTKWQRISKSGVFTVTVGGTVDNSVVYFEKGKAAAKDFKPVGINGYGIDSMWVNGVAVEPMSVYSTADLQEDVVIKVRFVTGGVTPVAKPVDTQIATFPAKLHHGQLSAVRDAEITLYSVAGKRIATYNLTAGQSVTITPISKGVYLLKAVSAEGVTHLQWRR